MSTHTPTNMVRTIDLGHEQMLVIEDRPGSCIRVLLGGVWLTEERHLQDRFARAGGTLCLQAPGRAVLEAMGHTRLQVVEPLRQARAGWGRLVRLAGAVRNALQGMPLARVPMLAVALVIGLGLPELIGRGFQLNA